MKRRTFPAKIQQQGSVLIEAMVAILLFSIGVLAVAGLQASMIQNTTESKLRAEASYLAQQIVGRMWCDLKGTKESNFTTVFDISDRLPAGTLAVTKPLGLTDRYEIEIKWQQEGHDAHRFLTTVTIPDPTPLVGGGI